MKVLIWDKDFSLKDTGGPAGYLYKVHEYLKQTPTDEIIFYSDIFADNSFEDSNWEILKKALLGKIPLKVIWGKIVRRLTKQTFDNFRMLFHTYYAVPPLSEKEINLMNSVDYVHFHLISSVLRYYPYFKYINSKTILTTHTPEPNITEIEGYRSAVKRMTQYKWVKDKLLKREAFGYQVVDYIMLPVPTAQEAYTSNCPILKKAFYELQNKIFYVPTAIQESVSINQEKQKEYAEKLSSYPFKVCFIGRHNSIKGYDKLQDIAKSCWQKNPNITFVIGGTEKPMMRLDDSRWIELGWIDTSALLESIDMFVLPNKQTYFDLILLEVLRQGIPCILSETGGNKWFINKHINGIYGYEYDDVEAAANLIVHLSHKANTTEWSEIRSNCLEEFKRYYTMSTYVDTYLSQLKLLTDGRGKSLSSKKNKK